MATAVEVQEVNLEPQKEEALALASQAQTLTVTSPETFSSAGEMLKAVVAKGKWWAELIAPAKKAAKLAHSRICDLEKVVADPLQAVENHLRRQISTYSAEQERLRRIEEARLQEIQRKETEEAARLAAEARQIEDAVSAEQAGNQEVADAIIAAPVVPDPVFTAPVVVQSSVPKVSGVSTRKVWKFRVVDPLKVPRDFLLVDEQKLRKFASTMGQQAVVAGVEFYAEETAIVR